jgi:hypothetical protein
MMRKTVMPIETVVSKDDPLMIAWEDYKSSDEYANSFNWAAREQQREGSMWAAFVAGWNARTRRRSGELRRAGPA